MMSTSLALPTSPSTAQCATQPVHNAKSGASLASATVTMPASCTTVISGIAAKLTSRPANVTREKTNAPTGSSAISAQSEAANSAATG